MSNQSSPKSNQNQGIILKPFMRLPALITALGLVLLLLPIPYWPSILVSTFGIFLLIQTLILRLEITSQDLVVWQLGKELRRFPFKEWISWRLFLPKLPGILYFREEASPHLLPILFDPNELADQLRLRVGSLEISKPLDQTPKT